MPHAYDEATLCFYAEEAPVYSSSGPGGASRHLAGFLELLEPGAKVLEIGCGGGRDAEWMLAQGFDVEPTDGVAEMAVKAEARLGRPVRVMRFDELDDVGGYDAVWANASLLHVPRASLPAVYLSISELADAYRQSGGWRILSVVEYEGGGYDEATGPWVAITASAPT